MHVFNVEKPFIMGLRKLKQEELILNRLENKLEQRRYEYSMLVTYVKDLSFTTWDALEIHFTREELEDYNFVH